MESTLFTALIPEEEANLSGGNTKKITKNNRVSLAFKILNLLNAKASNSVAQTATGGNGGNGGTIGIGGGSNSPVVIINSPVSANGGAGGGATNLSDNAVGSGAA